MGFDIRTLRDFELPRFQCEHCLGLLFEDDVELDTDRCAACGIPYAGDLTMYMYMLKHSEVNITDPIRRANILVSSIEHIEEGDWPPMRTLFVLLSQASSFVHIATHKIDWQMLGALRLLSERIPVSILVSAPGPDLAQEVRDFASERPYRLALRIPDPSWSEPHQKVVVIDGMLAITGSADFCTSAWRNAASDREMLNVHTDVKDVVSVHNRYFAKHWSEHGPKRRWVQTDDVPF